MTRTVGECLDLVHTLVRKRFRDHPHYVYARIVDTVAEMSGSLFGADHPHLIEALLAELNSYNENYSPNWRAFPDDKRKDEAFNRVWRASMDLSTAFVTWKKQFACMQQRGFHPWCATCRPRRRASHAVDSEAACSASMLSR